MINESRSVKIGFDQYCLRRNPVTLQGYGRANVEYMTTEYCLQGRPSNRFEYQDIACAPRHDGWNTWRETETWDIPRMYVESYLEIGDGESIGIRTRVKAAIDNPPNYAASRNEYSETICYKKSSDSFDSSWNPFDGTDDASCNRDYQD